MGGVLGCLLGVAGVIIVVRRRIKNRGDEAQKLSAEMTLAGPKPVLVAMYAFESQSPEEVSLHEGEKVLQIETGIGQWTRVQNQFGSVGLVPSNCLARM